MKKFFRFWARLIKPLVPQRLFEVTDPLGHGIEAGMAAAVNGWPARRLRVIGVTGTNGKTTTSVLIASVLEAAGFRVGLSTTAVFQVGVEKFDNELNATVSDPWRLQKLLKRMADAKVDWVVLEVTSHALAQNRVLGTKFEAVVMTNISQDHLDYHSTMERYVAAKARLFAGRPKLMVLNADDSYFGTFDTNSAGAKLNYGLSERADVKAIKIQSSEAGSSFVVATPLGQEKIELKLPGKFNIYNALAAVAVGVGLKLHLDQIARGLAAVDSVPGRMEKIEMGQPFGVIVDYAHSPDALEKLYGALKGVTKGRLIAVFGATGDRDRSKRPIMGKIAGELADVVVLTDEEPYGEEPATIIAEVRGGVEQTAKILDQDFFVVEDRRVAMAKAFELARPGDVVAITGMGHQKYRLEKGKKLPWDDRAVARELLAK